nr:MAG: hypothetical protein J07AB56_03700 [Candidatus Nanosalinarum sp. J07AB56]
MAVVALLLSVSAGSVVLADASSSEVKISKLTTECRIDSPAETARYTLENGKLRFSGHFPTKGPDPELDYRYSQSADTINIEVDSDSEGPHTTFTGECLPSAVYEATTRNRQRRIPPSDAS